uniref:Daxx histone-binding domain-containing protein n=1 Tax=Macrostomum lignano TaxID=282301 RepID=A0A1I8F8L3_9PLAT
MTRLDQRRLAANWPEFEAAWCQLESFLSNLLHNDELRQDIVAHSLRRHFDAAWPAVRQSADAAGARRLFDSLPGGTFAPALFKLVCALDSRLDLQESLADAPAKRRRTGAGRVDDETEKSVGEDVSGKASDDDDDAAGNSEEPMQLRKLNLAPETMMTERMTRIMRRRNPAAPTKADTDSQQDHKSSGTRKIIKKKKPKPLPKKRRIALTRLADSPILACRQIGRPLSSGPLPKLPGSLSASDFDNRAGDDADLTPEERQKARALQDCLCRILTKIKRLQQLEMSLLNDLSSESSVYLQEDRLKQRAVQVSTTTGLPLRRPPQSPAYFLAARFRYDLLGPPGDRRAHRVLTLIGGADSRDLPKSAEKLSTGATGATNWAGLRPRSRRCAETVFKDVGEQLQDRRKRDLFRLSVHRPAGRADPAEADADLRQRLGAGRRRPGSASSPRAVAPTQAMPEDARAARAHGPTETTISSSDNDECRRVVPIEDEDDDCVAGGQPAKPSRFFSVAAKAKARCILSGQSVKCILAWPAQAIIDFWTRVPAYAAVDLMPYSAFKFYWLLLLLLHCILTTNSTAEAAQSWPEQFSCDLQSPLPLPSSGFVAWTTPSTTIPTMGVCDMFLIA